MGREEDQGLSPEDLGFIIYWRGSRPVAGTVRTWGFSVAAISSGI